MTLFIFIDMGNPEVPPAPIFNSDGSLNEGVLDKHYGLGIREAQQEVTFGNYTGTVAEMLSDGRCPVGGRLETAYREDGIDGVVKQFEALSAMDPNFRVKITPQTLERNHVKKK